MALRGVSVLLLLLLFVTTSNGWRRRRRRGWAGCSSLSKPPLGMVTLSGQAHGSKATYTCDSGYIIGTGDHTRTCNNGAWTGHAPTCILGCIIPRTPLNGTVSIVGTSAYYSCISGSKMIGTRIRQCIERAWSGSEPECDIQCSTNLTNPRYGSVSIRDNKATYNCSINYKIAGVAVRLCSKNGVWMGSPPLCVLECGHLDNPLNGRVTVRGITAHYHCNSGYRRKGGVLRLCKGKKWTGTAPICSKVCSTTLDIPVHGSLSIRDDNATYTCAANYKIQGVAVRQCSNGEWLGNTPKCILECSRLENPVNGNVTVSGNTAHYKCNADYYIEGSVLRTCKDQKWTGSAPLCTKRIT
jgi:hypothetical protein